MNSALQFNMSPYAPFMQETKVTLGNGIELHVEMGGNPEHPTILLIMGLGAQMLFWPDFFCKSLIDQGFRVIRFVRPRQTYTGHLTRHSTPTVTDEEALRESEVALLLHALAKRVTPQQMEIIRLRTKGYQTNEIAQMQNTSLYHVNTLLDNARFIVVELCRDA